MASAVVAPPPLPTIAPWWSRRVPAVSLTATALVLLVMTGSGSRVALWPSARQPVPVAAVAAAAWRFVRYEPSAWETEWASHIDAWYERECAVLISPPHIEHARAWLALSVESQTMATLDAAAAAASLALHSPSGGILSHFLYELPDGKTARIAVEPLAGVLRDPRSVCDRRSASPATSLNDPLVPLQSKEHIYLDPTIFALAHALLPVRGRVVIFDVGATTYSDTDMPGLSWIYALLKSAGLQPTDVYSWEVTPRPGDMFFKGMPQALLSAEHFYNFPAEAGVAGHDPTEILRSFAPGDFVVFKLDIDNTPAEEAIIEKLLCEPSLMALIDVLFWEHHVDVPEMRGDWGVPSKRLNASYDYFTRLREAGVQARSWP